MSDTKPNWSKWDLIDNAELLKVTALSLDIDPDKVRIENQNNKLTIKSYNGLHANHFKNADCIEFRDRFEIIKENYEKIDPNPKSISSNGIAYCALNIPKFAKWAIEKNLVIPDELKKRAKSAQENNAENILPTYQTDLLKILNLAIKEFFEPRKNPDAKKMVVTEWLKNKGVELKIPVTKNMADAIFTIIKPADHNPRIKRVEPKD